MEIEKKFWDMRKKDYLKIFSRFWLILFLLAAIVGTAIFLTGYYDQIINKAYTSRVEYLFAYIKKVPDNSNPGSFIDQLSDPSLYMNMYSRHYTSKETIKEVESILEKGGDEKLAYKSGQLSKFIEVTRDGYNLEISVTTKVPEHSKKIADTLSSIAMPKILEEKNYIAEADKDSKLEISNTAVPTLGINYVSEEETLINLTITTIVSVIAIMLLGYLLIVTVYNFNGKFKRLDVFENNFQIPVLGEITISMYKEN